MSARLTDRERINRAIPEAAFQAQVIALAHALGYRVAHFRTVRVQRANGSTHYATPVAADGAGFPDLVLVRKGRMIAAELKRETGKPTPEQYDWLEALNAAGVETFVWRPRDLELIEGVLA